MNKVQVIITGMHRSGTSILSNWLRKCGLNLGDELLISDFSNPSGHFEDLDFLNLHKGILKWNNVYDFTVCNSELKISEYHDKKASFLVKFKNSLRSQWGWKDPRTCLFLHFWHKKLDSPKYIFIWRDCESVVNSLIKRELNRDKSNLAVVKKYIKIAGYYKRYITTVDMYINSWMKFNNNIIEFCNNTSSNDYIVTKYEELLGKSDEIYDICNEKWALNVNDHDINELFSTEIGTRNNKYTKNFKLLFQRKQLEIGRIEDEMKRL